MQFIRYRCSSYWLLWFIIINYLIHFFLFYDSIFTEVAAAIAVDKTLDGIMMRPISEVVQCSNRNEPLLPQQVHIIMLASADMFQKQMYRTNIETFVYYSVLHGYKFRTVDPIPVIDYYAAESLKKRIKGRQLILHGKSHVMNYYLREEFHTYGCEVRWILFLDADVMVTNFARSLISLIDFTNHLFGYNNTTEQPQCHLIAQLTPFAINTGVLLLKVSTETAKELQAWVNITERQVVAGVNWLVDQGRFQELYLQYLHIEQKIPIVFNCSRHDTNDAVGLDHAVNGIRNHCFMKNLYTIDLLPPHLVFESILNIAKTEINGSSQYTSSALYKAMEAEESVHHLEHDMTLNDSSRSGADGFIHNNTNRRLVSMQFMKDREARVAEQYRQQILLRQREKEIIKKYNSSKNEASSTADINRLRQSINHQKDIDRGADINHLGHSVKQQNEVDHTNTFSTLGIEERAEAVAESIESTIRINHGSKHDQSRGGILADIFIRGYVPQPHSGIYCMLPPYSSWSSFNLHDYDGKNLISNNGANFNFQPLIRTPTEMQMGECIIPAPLFYHGKVNIEPIHNLWNKLKDMWNSTLKVEDGKNLFDNVNDLQDLSLLLTEDDDVLGIAEYLLPDDPRFQQKYKEQNAGVCSREMLGQLRFTGRKSSWMSPAWQDADDRIRTFLRQHHAATIASRG